MPTKLNKAGKQQEYIPAGNGDPSGEYGTANGTNKNFTKPNVITENKPLTPKKENESKVVMSDRKDEETKTNQKVVEANVIDDMEKINAKETLDKIIDPNINYSSEKEVKQVGDMLKDLDSIVDYEIKYKDANGNERTVRATDVDSEQFVKMLDSTIGKNANYMRNAERLSNTKVMVKDGDGNRKEVVANAKTLKQMLNRAKRETKANVIDGDLTKPKMKLGNYVDEVANIVEELKDKIKGHGDALEDSQAYRTIKDFSQRLMWDTLPMIKEKASKELKEALRSDDISDAHIETLLRKSFEKAGINTRSGYGTRNW